jgi:hypothetical protein
MDENEAKIGLPRDLSESEEKEARPKGHDLMRKILSIVDRIPISIYLANELGHEMVQALFEGYMIESGFEIYEREPEIYGSWFRRMWARLVRSPVGQGALHAVDNMVVLGQDADIAERMLRNLAPVLDAIRPENRAVIRAGALLTVKSDQGLAVVQLTAAQQNLLNSQPSLSLSPQDILGALEAIGELQGYPQLPAVPDQTDPEAPLSPRL